MNNNLILEDTTLRDGEQAPGIALSKDKKLRILSALVDAGVRWIEVGIPVMGGEELEYIKSSRQFADRARLVAWNRGVRDDVEFSLDLGFDTIHIGLPTSDAHLSASVSKTRGWVMQKAADLIKLAKDRGAFVSVSSEDVGRTDPSFLQDYAGLVAESGADRLRLSDTIGCLSPAQYAEKVRLVTDTRGIDVQCHCHNDFGLATANTLAGIAAGARYFHVCVNGMGERAGMPDLAQMVMALKFFHDTDVGIDTTKLTDLSALVSEATGFDMEPWKPVVGSNVFAHESGIHSKGMLRDEKTFEPVSPNDVGGERRIVIGKHTGRSAIQHVMKTCGIEADSELLQSCLERIREAAMRRNGEIKPAQLVAIYRELESDRLRAVK